MCTASMTAVRSSICVSSGGSCPGGSRSGESGPAVVDRDHASESAQSIEDVCHAGQLPVEEQVRDEPGDVDEVAGALSEDLERDVRSVRRLRVANLRDLHEPYGRSSRGRPANPRELPRPPGRYREHVRLRVVP
jgi:hypothetical protein